MLLRADLDSIQISTVALLSYVTLVLTEPCSLPLLDEDVGVWERADLGLEPTSTRL